MKKTILTLLTASLLLLTQSAMAQSKGKTIIIKQYHQDNGDWKTDTIGNFNFDKMLNFKYEIDKHLKKNLTNLENLIPDKSQIDSMMTIIDNQMMSLDTSFAKITKLIANKIPKMPDIESKIDSLIESELAKTQIKIIRGNSIKKVIMVNGNKVEINQNTDENKINVDYYSDEEGVFTLQLLTDDEEILYEKKDEITSGKYSFSFSTQDYKPGHYLIKIRHNHLFLLEQLQIMHN